MTKVTQLRSDYCVADHYAVSVTQMLAINENVYASATNGDAPLFYRRNKYDRH
jgi:hypothetical protein